MSNSSVHVGDIGTQFKVQVLDNSVPVNLVGATSKVFVYKKPTGISVTKPALFVTTGVDGWLYYRTVLGDLDVSGIWELQVVVALAGGIWHSEITTFTVAANL